MKTIVEVKKLVKKFPIGNGFFTALQGVDLEFSEGEFAGLVGPSGSGKTTLLNIIGSLDIPSEGEVIVLGKSVGKLTPKEAARLRKEKLGFIFQNYNLLPVYTVFENVEFPLLLLDMSAEERKNRVLETLEWVGLTEKVKSRPSQLSGGECQRVAIARALVTNPGILLADEPTGALDSKTGDEIMMLFDELHKEGNTIILITHEQEIANYAHRTIHIKDGMIHSDNKNEIRY